MPRTNGQDCRAMRVRESQDAALLALVDCLEVMPFIQLRLQQAIERHGLSELLGPASRDLTRLSSDIVDAQVHMRAANRRLVE